MSHPKTNEATSPDANVDEAMRLVDAAMAALALTTPPVTTRQKKQAAKARKGAEKVIPTILLLAKHYGLNIPLQPTDAMSTHLELAKRLEPLQKKLQAFQASIDANAFLANSASWTTAKTLYALLKRIAKVDPAARAQLAPVQEFFAFRSAAVRAKNPRHKGQKAALAVATKEANASKPPAPPEETQAS